MTEGSLKRLRGTVLALCSGAALLCMAAPAGAQSPADCVSPAKPMARLELVFGQGSGRQHVSQHAWGAFVSQEITPRFPAGFTLFDGRGQWRDTKGLIEKEASRLLLVWYAREPDSDAKIEAIRARYKKRFHQQSVLRVDGFSCVAF